MIDYPPLDTSAPTFPSEADLVHLMCRHVPYIEQYWVYEDEEHGYFGSLDVNEFQPPGGPINEMIIRSLGDELRGYAALHQSAFFDPSVAGIEKPILLDRLNRCLRWICAHHLSGSRRTEPLEWNGQWGDDWESSLWIADIAMAANHVADELEPDVLEAFHRVLAFEADRFLGVDPPDGRWHDTKEEENAWDSYLLAWAHCLLPDHPHADEWLYRGKLFAINTFTTDLDRVDTRLFDGTGASPASLVYLSSVSSCSWLALLPWCLLVNLLASQSACYNGSRWRCRKSCTIMQVEPGRCVACWAVAPQRASPSGCPRPDLNWRPTTWRVVALFH